MIFAIYVDFNRTTSLCFWVLQPKAMSKKRKRRLRGRDRYCLLKLYLGPGTTVECLETFFDSSACTRERLCAGRSVSSEEGDPVWATTNPYFVVFLRKIRCFRRWPVSWALRRNGNVAVRCFRRRARGQGVMENASGRQPARSMQPGALSALTACRHSSSRGAHRSASSSNLVRAMNKNSPGPTAGLQPRPNAMVNGPLPWLAASPSSSCCGGGVRSSSSGGNRCALVGITRTRDTSPS